ncbi:hypothetical protein C7N43_09900 [Sphingobacteriales bacterium UPWRP_1]|nr:hypothetical protein B6N25_12010 [Sphingobacteriales bacterium TSM_CSS]PSJ77245.1 hypothetical protein C7N43_09900 [Sphingobacteriales bacterium UPWRP_1]
MFKNKLLLLITTQAYTMLQPGAKGLQPNPAVKARCSVLNPKVPQSLSLQTAKLPLYAAIFCTIPSFLGPQNRQKGRFCHVAQLLV